MEITPSPNHAELLDPAPSPVQSLLNNLSSTGINGLAFDAAAAARHLAATTTDLYVGLSSRSDATVPDGWKSDLLARIDAARAVLAELPTPTCPRVAIPAALQEPLVSDEELNGWLREIDLEQSMGVSA